MSVDPLETMVALSGEILLEAAIPGCLLVLRRDQERRLVSLSATGASSATAAGWEAGLGAVSGPECWFMGGLIPGGALSVEVEADQPGECRVIAASEAAFVARVPRASATRTGLSSVTARVRFLDRDGQQLSEQTRRLSTPPRRGGSARRLPRR